MEIYKHFYNTYGSVEKQFQARFGKKPAIQPKLSGQTVIKETAELTPFSQEELDKIINDPDLLKGFDNPDNKPVY